MGVVNVLLEAREKGCPFADLADFRKRVTLSPHSLAALVRAGAFGGTGRGREALLAEAGTATSGRPQARGITPSPWPVGGADGSAQSALWRSEWELLGFSCGPPLLTLARPALPHELSDSRALSCERQGKKARLAGLVVSEEKGALVLLDEFGLFEAELVAGAVVPRESELVLVEGVVDVRHGAPVLKG